MRLMSSRLAGLAIAGLCALGSVALTPVAAQKAPVDPAALALAKEVMSVAGAAQQFENVMPMLMGQMATAMTAGQPPDKVAVVKEIFDKVATKAANRKDELLDQIAGIYALNLTIEDMKALIVFYNTPAGKKLIAAQPMIQQQSMVLGQAWGQKLAVDVQKDVMDEMKKRGVQYAAVSSMIAEDRLPSRPATLPPP
jgi:uncharacterized protein